jgi:hypothetical protein
VVALAPALAAWAQAGAVKQHAVSRHLLVEGAHLFEQGFQLGAGRLAALTGDGGTNLDHESHDRSPGLAIGAGQSDAASLRRLDDPVRRDSTEAG